jgi:hypothetical protein
MLFGVHIQWIVLLQIIIANASDLIQTAGVNVLRQ